MTNGAMVRLIAVLVVSVVTVSAQTEFEKAKAELHLRLDKKLPDGSIKESKQVKRWEWFWTPRLNEDGSFPKSVQYLREARLAERSKGSEEMQARPRWIELGPTAPDLPNESSVWNGIGRVNTVSIAPSDANLIYVGSAAGGVWKTTNGGSSWQHVVIQGYPLFGVSDIALAPSNNNVIYVATGDVEATIPGASTTYPGFSFGIVKSTDGGATWQSTALSSSLEDNRLVSRLWVHPTNPDIVIAATYLGIQKSTDGGASWRMVTSAMAFRDLIGNPQVTDMLYATTFAVGGGARIYRSTNGGDAWTEVLSVNEASRIRLAVTKADSKMVGAVAVDASTNGLFAIYKSGDFGATFVKSVPQQNLLGWASSGNDWNYGGQGFYDLAMEISPWDANKWFVGGVNAWRSTNAGQTWVLSAHWTGSDAPWVHADHHVTRYGNNANRLYTVTDGGISRSTDNGVSWRDISNGLKVQQFYGLAVSNLNSTLTIAGAQDNGTCLTTDGNDFEHVLDGDGMMTAADVSNPQLLYGSQYYGTFFRSTDLGYSWRMISTAGQRGESRGAWAAPIEADPKTSSTVYVGYSQIYKSTNMGGAWTRISQINAPTYMRIIAVAPSDNKYIYVGYETDVYFTTNGGTSWQVLNVPGNVVQDIEVHPTNPKKVWVTLGGYSQGTKIYEFNNGVGANITGTGLPNVPCNAVVFQAGVLNRLYAGTDVGVFFKDEGANSWEPYGEGMPTCIVSGMKLLPNANKLRVSTYGRGIWEVEATQCKSSVPQIAVIGSTSFCAGDSVILQASPGYAKYQWSNGATTDKIVLKSQPESGSYTVSVEDQNGCRNMSSAVVVTILKAPVKPMISVKGTDTLRSSAIGGITNFQWYVNGVPIEGANQREYVPKASGSYTVTAINSDGCGTTSSEYNFVTSGVEFVLEQQKLKVWPVPTQSEIEVQLPEGTSRTLELLTLTGKLAQSVEIQDGVKVLGLDLTDYVAGTYLLRVVSGNSVWSGVVVRQ